MIRPWTTTEISRLREMYQTMTISDIAVQLNRSPTSVANTARRFGIAKTAYAKSNLIRAGRLREVTHRTCMGKALRRARELLQDGDRNGALRVIDDALCEIEGRTA